MTVTAKAKATTKYPISFAIVPRPWTEYQVLSPKQTVSSTTTLTMKRHQHQQQLRRQPLLRRRRRRRTTTISSSIATMSGSGSGGGMTMTSLRKFSTMEDNSPVTTTMMTMTMTVSAVMMARTMLLSLLLCTTEFPTCDAFQLHPVSPPRRRPLTPQLKPPSPPPSAAAPATMTMMMTIRSTGQLNNKDGKEEEKDDDSSFVQRPGENDIDFIKRITMESEQRLRKATKKNMNMNTNTKEGDGRGEQQQQDNPRTKKQNGTYQRIEEWEEERRKRSKGGELTWEERVQFDGQRFGDQVRQQSILEKHIGTFWRK